MSRKTGHMYISVQCVSHYCIESPLLERVESCPTCSMKSRTRRAEKNLFDGILKVDTETYERRNKGIENDQWAIEKGKVSISSTFGESVLRCTQ